jgi:hypothetical protein
LWITSRTVSGSVKTTSEILGGLMPWAESKTICARRQVTTEPVPRRTIRSSRLPSSGVISRSSTLAAIFPSRSRTDAGKRPSAANAETLLWKPANVAGHTTSTRHR